MTRVLLIVTAAAAVVVVPSTSLAETLAVHSDGVVHRIHVETWTDGSTTGGTVLRHVVQRPNGYEDSRFVTGTEDLEVDRDPALGLDPITGDPILVWVRGQDGAGSHVLISRRVRGAWAEPQLLYADGGVNREPQLRIDRALVHVVWRQDAGEAPLRLRVSLDRESLAPAFGPEELPTESPDPLSADGGTGSDPSGPTEDLSYFACHIPSGSEGSPGPIMVWGIRDEPIPIVYLEAFSPPAGIGPIPRTEAGWIAGRFVLWFTAPGKFYYVLWKGEGWSDLRLITLTDSRTAADARLAVEAMIRREATPPEE